MNDLKLVLWRLPLEHVPDTGNIAALDVAWHQNPAMLEHLSDGWVVKSHTLTAHRAKVDGGPGPLTPPPELLLWEDGSVTWDKPGHGPAARD